MLDWIRRLIGAPEVAPFEPARPLRAELTAKKVPHDWLENSPWKDNAEASAALRSLEHSRRNVFITGAAGSGKSTLLRYWREHTSKRVQVVAPTGVAALNVEGRTLHSFFKLPPQLLQPRDIEKVFDRSKWAWLQTLVIDEISMVRADMLDAVDQFLRLNGPRPGEAFGGVQIVMVGDPLQLPPVVGPGLVEYFHRADDRGPGYPAPYFFASKAWHADHVQCFDFQRIYRQEDGPFLSFLNRARVGDVSDIDLLLLNSLVSEPSEDEAKVSLVGANAVADRINSKRLGRLAEPEGIYRGAVVGRWAEKDLPVPVELRLRRNAWVMMAKNDALKRWVNGSFGIVEEMGKESVWVRVYSENRPTALHEVLPDTWTLHESGWTRDGTAIHSKSESSYRQIPLNLAWAITIHKSQGKTLKKARLDIGNGLWESGHAYTALSRLKNLEGLALTRPLTKGDFKTSQVVRGFLDQIGKDRPRVSDSR